MDYLKKTTIYYLKYIKANGKMIKDMAWDIKDFLIHLFFMDIIIKENLKDKENSLLPMDKFMRVNGNKELNMAKRIGKDPQDKHTLGNGIKASLKALEYSLTKKVINTKEISRTH